jgi:Bardet-Biedl syndrome 2 protein
MLIPAFQLNLNHTILPGLVTIGKFDGKRASLTCATDGGRLFVHCPQEGSGAEVRFLSINKEVSGLAAGPLDPNLGRDVLLVGMRNQLLVFDVEENVDLIFKEVLYLLINYCRAISYYLCVLPAAHCFFRRRDPVPYAH